MGMTVLDNCIFVFFGLGLESDFDSCLGLVYVGSDLV